MHGVPEYLTDKATTDQLKAMWEVVLRDIKDTRQTTIANGVSLGVWGDGKK